MSDSDVSFSGQMVRVAGQTWEAPWPVKQAATIDGRVILLYDYMAGPRHRQFQNLEAFSLSGQRLWTAEHPTSETADAYAEILSTSPFVVWDFACYRCVIDPSNGRLVDARRSSQNEKHMVQQTGCTERRDRVSVDNRTSLARRR